MLYFKVSGQSQLGEGEARVGLIYYSGGKLGIFLKGILSKHLGTKMVVEFVTGVTQSPPPSL